MAPMASLQSARLCLTGSFARYAVVSMQTGRTSMLPKRAGAHLIGSSRSSLQNAPRSMQARTLFTQREPRPVRTTVKWTLLAFALTFGVAYHLDSRSAVHRWVAMPILQRVTDPETAQKLAIKLLSLGIMPRDLGTDDDILSADIAGLSVKNPIGLAAGFDKQAEAIDGLLNLGFGIVEVGSVTPKPQPGNDIPRYFRLTSDRAAINRFGFNSEGHDVILHRLRERIQNWLLGSSTLAKSRIPLPDSESASHKLLEHATIDTLLESDHVPKSLRPGQLLAVNLGKNKTSSAESVEDYVAGVTKLGPYADLLVVNVSSPNTPGLRGLQRKNVLSDLMGQVVKARDELPLRRQSKVPILVKIAPDLDKGELHDIADAALASGVEGLIVSNTTISRPLSLLSPPEVTNETGGLSGAPLKPLSLAALQTVRQRVGKRMTIIGCGGIFSGQDALDFARAGADAVELYTSFGYEGVGHPRRVKDELTALLKAQGTTWKQSVGQGITTLDNTKSVLPENERDTSKAGNMHDRFDQTVAGVKGEIEEWRRTLGMQTVQRSAVVEQVSPVTRTARESLPFAVDPNDKAYTGLLDKVHEALGVERDSTTAQRVSTMETPMSQTEALRARIGMALQNPNVAPSVAIQGAGEHATVATGDTPVSGREVQPFSLAEPRGSGLAAAGAGAGKKRSAYDGEARLGMGGKSEFNAADRLRVV